MHRKLKKKKIYIFILINDALTSLKSSLYRNIQFAQNLQQIERKISTLEFLLEQPIYKINFITKM